ncbi:MAG: hypothetical protein GXO23_06685 [Crenarchaeota archaeon]|nr:hypothetical protein [Thermoproteota archaeon]
MNRRTLLTILVPLVIVMASLMTVPLNAQSTMVTIKGTVYVYYNTTKTYVPIAKVPGVNVSKLVIFFKPTLTSFEIYKNSTYVAQVPAEKPISVYIALAENPLTKNVPAYFNISGVLMHTYTFLPTLFGAPSTVNIVVNYSELMKIIPPPAVFKVSVVKTIPTTVTVGETYVLSVSVKNVGKATGTDNLCLYINKTCVCKKVTVSPGETKTVDFAVKFNATGTYLLKLTSNGAKVWSETVKAISKPKYAYKVVSVQVPSQFISDVPGTVTVTIENTGTAPVTLAVKAVALLKSPVGNITSSTVSKNVRIEPGKTAKVCLSVVFHGVGTGYVDVYVNKSLVYSKSVKVIYVSVKVAFAKKSYILTLGEEKNVTLLLLNGSKAAGVSVTIRYNSSVINVVAVKAGDFKSRVSGLATYSINNKKGIVKIVIAGSTACGVNKTVIAYITLKAVSVGKTTLRVNGTWSNVNGQVFPVMGVPANVTVTKKVAIFNGTISAPSTAYAGVPFNVKVTVKNIGNAPGKASVEIKYDNKVCAGPVVTPVLSPGETWTHTFKCTISTTGTYTLSLVVNGTVKATTSVTVKKVPPYKVYMTVMPKMYVYWAGYPVTLNVTVVPKVKTSTAINITVVEVTPYEVKVVGSLFEPLVVGKAYSIVKKILLPTYTTTGEIIVYVNGVPVNRTSFKTTGVAVVVKPRTYELISVPVLPLSYASESQSLPAPPPGSAPVKLPTLAQVFSLVYDVRTGKKVNPWSAIAVYYYNRAASSAPFYVAISPTSTPVRPGMGLVVYSAYPHELVLIVPINVTAVSSTTLKTLLMKTLELAYVPSPLEPGWAIVGPIGLVPVKLLPSKFLNLTLYYTESTSNSAWTTVETVTTGDYVYPGKGYWIFWNLLTIHALHQNMESYLSQYYSVLGFAKSCK